MGEYVSYTDELNLINVLDESERSYKSEVKNQAIKDRKMKARQSGH